jgi:hypothetical protein
MKAIIKLSEKYWKTHFPDFKYCSPQEQEIVMNKHVEEMNFLIKTGKIDTIIANYDQADIIILPDEIDIKVLFKCKD